MFSRTEYYKLNLQCIGIYSKYLYISVNFVPRLKRSELWEFFEIIIVNMMAGLGRASDFLS